MFATTFKRIAPLALAATMTAVTVMPADAQSRNRVRNAGLIGAAVGALAAGAVIANRRARPVYVAPAPVYVAPRPVYRAPRRVVYRDNSWAGHVARCYAAYRSYDERSDTYQPYSGPRRRCTK